MSRSTVDASEQQTAKHSPDKHVSHVRAELESLMEVVVGLEDPDSLIGAVEEMGQYLIFLQWKEQQLLPLISDARARYNNAQEIVRQEEDREALRLNNSGVAMNRAEKMARLAMSDMREQLNAFQEARNRYEDEYTDLKGFRNVVQECKMTIHQKVKMLYSEYKQTPFQVERNH